MSDSNQQDQHQDRQNGSSSSDLERKKSKRMEWMVAALGLLLVAGAICFVLYQAIWGSEMPPDVQIQVSSIDSVQNGWLVHFKARNQGGATLAGLMMEANLKRGSEKIESSQTSIDYLPANSERKGGFFFTQNPHLYSLETRASGYQQP